MRVFLLSPRLFLVPLRPFSRFSQIPTGPKPKKAVEPVLQLLKAIDLHTCSPLQEPQLIQSLVSKAKEMQTNQQLVYRLELNLLLKTAKLLSLPQTKGVSSSKSDLALMTRLFLSRQKGQVKPFKLNYLLTYLKKLNMLPEVALFLPEVSRLLEEEPFEMEALAMLFNLFSLLARSHPLLSPDHPLLVSLIDAALNKDFLNTAINEKFLQVLFESYMLNYEQLQESVFFKQLVSRVKQHQPTFSDKTLTFLTNNLSSCPSPFSREMLLAMEQEWLKRLPGLDSKQFCLVMKAYNKNKAISPCLQSQLDQYLQRNKEHIKVYDYVQIFIQYSKSETITKEFIQEMEEKVMLVFSPEQKVSLSNASIYQELIYSLSHSASTARLLPSSYQVMGQFLVAHLSCFSYVQVASIVPCVGFLKQNESTSCTYNQVLHQVDLLLPRCNALECIKSLSSLYLTYSYQYEQPARFPPPARSFFQQAWADMDQHFHGVFLKKQKVPMFVINLQLALSFQKNHRRSEVTRWERGQYENIRDIMERVGARRALVEGVDGEELAQIEESLESLLQSRGGKGKRQEERLLEGLEF